MNEDIVIWGAGIWGDVAYNYYKKRGNIVCYVDNDQRKWGGMLNTIKICSPIMLQNRKVKVVLALKNEVQAVIKQLEEYNIESYTLFQVKEETYSGQDAFCKMEGIQEDTCIIAFGGGLGNQMFQYALLRNLEVHGKKVLADLKSYSSIGVMDFRLTDVFQNIKLERCTEEQKQELVKKNIQRVGKAHKFIIYSEPCEYGMTKKADLSLLDITGGIIYGLHQNCIFSGQIRKTLLDDFSFISKREKKLQILQDYIMKSNAVSVHIRRGDYLTESNKWLYGDICTEEYYEKAIKYLRKKIGECTLYVFSNDIEWIKKNYCMKNAVYIEAGMFDGYQDWYDMYLMSICKHNIIANSTFSWWGAWLNRNDNKIVVAPQKWINIYKYEDIYPKEWVQI